METAREKRGVLESDSKDALSDFINSLSASQLDHPVESKRGVQNLNSWGKRVLVNLSPWGKRRWARLQSWGKRSFDPSATEDSDKDDIEAGIPSGKDEAFNKIESQSMPSWENSEDDADDELDDVDKRKWTGYASWGKRQDENVSDDLMSKRKWNQLSAWGKRSDDLTSDEVDAIKRKWNRMASWGKRSNWRGFNSWGKRNPWSSLATWGKRSKWSGFNAWGKRDGAENLD